MPIKTDNEYCLNFAANVRYLISLSGKQQQEVAADLGISTTAFNNYLVGRNLPKFQIMQDIASYFHVNVEDLVRPLVGNDVLFNERLTADEMNMLKAYRAASPSDRNAALRFLRYSIEVPQKPTPGQQLSAALQKVRASRGKKEDADE